MKVNTAHYRSAATKLTATARDAEAAFDALDSVLSGCGSMAGSTEACLAWAKEYDKAAAAAHGALAGTSDVLTSFAVACLLSAMNHEAAEHASAGKPHTYSAVPAMPASVVPLFPPPSAAGGNGIEPDNWGVIQKVQDIAWPDGDVNKLRAAAHAWGAAASAADELVTDAAAAKASLEAMQSGEMGAVEGKFISLNAHLTQVAAACRQTGSACAEYADRIKQVHDAVKDILRELAMAAGATIIVGIILSAASAGTSAAVAGCVYLAEASAAAARIVVIIDRVAVFAAQISLKLTPIAEAVAGTGRVGALSVKAVKFTPTLAKFTAIDSAVNTGIDAAEHGGKPVNVTGDIATAAVTSPLGPLGEKLGSKILGGTKQAANSSRSLTRRNEIYLDEMYRRAPAAKEEIDFLAEQLAAQYGGVVAKAPIKSRTRVTEKIQNDYNGNPSQMKDLARNTIIVPKDRIDAVRNSLRDKGAKLKIISAETNRRGYSGTNCRYRTKSGILAEIRINTPEMIYADEAEHVARPLLGDAVYDEIARKSGVPGGLGHQFYEEARSGVDPETDRRISKESREYYDRIRG